MKLYGHPLSTCTRKVLTTLAEKGHDAEFVLVDILKGEQKKPEYLALHPFGVVPLLQDGDFKLFESRAIIRYLNEVLPGPSLVPATAKGRGLMEQWISIESSCVTPHAMTLIWQLHFNKMMGKPSDLGAVEKARGELQRPLDVMDKALASQTYLAGDGFSLAEVCFLPYLDYLVAAQCGDLIKSRAHLGAWWQRVSTRPSWKKVSGNTK